jgi:hypothetical protein
MSLPVCFLKADFLIRCNSQFDPHIVQIIQVKFHLCIHPLDHPASHCFPDGWGVFLRPEHQRDQFVVPSGFQGVT